jgi:DNA-binding response OmpR family regulator
MNNESKTPGPWVLLVEEDTESSAALSEALKGAGYRVVIAAHVGEANAKLAQQRFSCIVTELYLGRGDGGQVIQDLRISKGMNAFVPAILMSAELGMETLQKLKPVINGVLLKPFDPQALVARVCTVLNQSGRNSLLFAVIYPGMVMRDRVAEKRAFQAGMLAKRAVHPGKDRMKVIVFHLCVGIVDVPVLDKNTIEARDHAGAIFAVQAMEVNWKICGSRQLLEDVIDLKSLGSAK